MRRRGAFVTTILVVAVLVVEAPIILFVGDLCLQAYRSGGHISLSFLGFNCGQSAPAALASCPTFLNSRLYGGHSITVDTIPKRTKYILHSIDLSETTNFLNPEVTKLASDEFPSPYPSPGGRRLHVFGDANHLWVIAEMAESMPGRIEHAVYRIDGNSFVPQQALPAMQQAPMALSRPLQDGSTFEYGDQLAFVLDGKLTAILEDVVGQKRGQRELYQLIEGQWVWQGEIKLLDRARSWQDVNGAPLVSQYPPNKVWSRTALGLLRVLPIGSTCHLFWRRPGKLLFRKTMALIPADLVIHESKSVEPIDEPISALEPENADGTTYDWQLVSDQIPNGSVWFPVVVGGEPAVIVIDELEKEYPIALAFRQENGWWNEFSRIELPFSSIVTQIGSYDDGSGALFAATSQWKRGLLVSIDPSGFHNTSVKYSECPNGLEDYVRVAFLFGCSLIAGIVLGLLATLCLWRDVDRYEFGRDSVRLASILERGCARLIDLFLFPLAIVTMVRGLVFVFDLDWRTAAEAAIVKAYDHPSFVAAKQIAIACFAGFIALSLLFVAVQGRFGTTPGKWICRLRTVRTTLRPSGFSRSLVRELLMCLDCVFFLSWTPGILSLVYSDMRQRLGDRFADTIVVRARSLNP